jgi:hypothetical protein
MKMNRIQRLLSSSVMILGLLTMGQNAIAQGKGHGGEKGPAEKGQGQKGPGEKAHGKSNHHNGPQMLGEKIHANGHHVIHQKGQYTTSVDVQNGKIAGVHVQHATKGDVPVTKYKTNKKMAQARGQIVYASLHLVQDTYLGTTYIGYAYVDEYGEEEIYWFPYDMVLDGDTGAVEYVPVE